MSARFMQKSIEYSKTNKLKYLCLVDEITKDVFYYAKFIYLNLYYR